MSDNSGSFEELKVEMIEDEEMPTYISVSSKEISLPYYAEMSTDNADNTSNHLQSNNGITSEEPSRSPITDERDDEVNENARIEETRKNEERGENCEKETDEDGEGSVYVVSSGDEDNTRRSEQSYEDEPDDEEDEDDEDEDEDIDDDIDDEIIQMPFPFTTDIEPDDDELEFADDINDEDTEREDVMSEDLNLRSKKAKITLEKWKSRSLQDLSFRTIAARQRTAFARRDRYHYLDSRVKRYVQEAQDMRRRSIDTCKETSEKVFPGGMSRAQNENCKVPEASKTDYRRNPLSQWNAAKNHTATLAKEGNGNEPKKTAMHIAVSKNEDHSDIPNHNSEMEEEEEERQEKYQSWPEQFGKEVTSSNNEVINGRASIGSPLSLKLPKDTTVILNGELPVQNILDVRTIGYDEYMRSGSCDKTATNLKWNHRTLPNNSKAMVTNTVEISDDPSMPACEIPSVETIDERMDVAENYPTVTSKLMEDRRNCREIQPQIELLQTQLNQKTTRCKEIHDAYQKTLTENFELKQELEDLKKTLSKLQTNVVRPEPVLVAVAIQTEKPSLRNESTDTGDEPSLKNVKSSSSIVASTISLNDHWTDTTCSLPTSNGSTRAPPNLTPLLNSDESVTDNATPSRLDRRSSYAFHTSSRIIKLLSSITQRKSKGEIPVSTPLAPRNSNKRKASDLPDTANFLQPTKIAHTATNGSCRMHRGTKSDPKQPRNQANSQIFPSRPIESEESSENLEKNPPEKDENDDRDSRVKCFTYQDDDNSLETSFLIQAQEERNFVEEENKDTGRPGQGIVRECGPYLLGNVEVRMSEVNGTINIWGKEVSQDTNPDDRDTEEQETNVEDESIGQKVCGRWQDTPDARYVNKGPVFCSTDKRLNVPLLKLNEVTRKKDPQSPLTSLSKDPTSNAEAIRERRQVRNSRERDADVDYRRVDGHCDTCNCNELKKSTISADIDSETVNKTRCACHFEHFRCGHTRKTTTKHCCNPGHSDVVPGSPHHQGDVGRRSCSREVRDNGHPTKKKMFRMGSPRHSSTMDRRSPLYRSTLTRSRSFPDNDNDDADDDGDDDDDDDDDDNDVVADDDEVFKRPTTSSYLRADERCCRGNSCRSQSLTNLNEDDPLLPRHRYETPEVRRRRLSGKRVRGILMDFLRGCGDCRTANVSTSQVSTNVQPLIRVTASSPPRVRSESDPPQRQSHCRVANNRCIHTEYCATCARRNDLAAENETQLEILRVEVERLRSHSDAILGMLNTLHAAEMN